jgi:hypothetical protein
LYSSNSLEGRLRVKKLLLTGVAALFLATGAAHTETNVRYGDPQAILPPPEYDYYPPGGFRVLTVPTHSELVRVCGQVGQEHAPFPSCGRRDKNGVCIILALPRLEMPAMGYDYEDVKRHEFGHCNGWPKDHAGMRSRPSPDPYKEAEEERLIPGMWMPPAEFDTPYTGELTILRMATEQDIRDACPDTDWEKSFQGRSTACTRVASPRKQCWILIASDQALKARHQNYAAVLRHELAHCNGWPTDHKGGKPVPLAGSAPAMPKLPPSTKVLPAYPPLVCLTPEWEPEPCASRRNEEVYKLPEVKATTPSLPWWIR